MAIQVINTGTSANSGNGDSIRTAFTKVNQNFDYLEGIVMGTSTNFNSGVRSVVKPMLVHDSHNGLVAAYNSINDRIVLTVGSNNFTSTNITAGNLTVANTSTFKDVQITGLLNIGIIQGFDDVNIIKFADDGSLNFRMRNTFGLGNTQINLLDQVNGSFNIIHQNSPANSGFFAAGQNYIYDDQGRAINIGRNSDINFYSRSGWNAYTTPEVAITNTAVNITSTLTLTKNFFNIGGKQLSVSGSSILLDNSAISVITDKLSAGIYTATLTTAGNIILPGDTSIAYNRRLPTGSTVTSFGATFSSDGPFNGVGSVYFDGSDRLEVYNDGQFDSVVDAYTIEWFQKPLTAGTLTDATILILGTEENQTVQARNFYATSVYSTGTYTAFTLEGSLEVVLPFTGTYINTWTHIAYVKSTSSFRAYINGNQVFSTNTNSFPTPISTSNNLVIGTRPTLATYENYYTGLLSNLRWEAREVYSSNFTPPSSKLTATTFTRFLLQSENSLNYLDDASGFGNERPQNIQFNISTSSLVLNQNGVLILNQHRDYEYGELAGNTFRIDTNHPYYTQMSIHNRNTATTATSDIVLVRDDGDLEAGTAILDIGINSSNYAEPGPFGIHSPGSAYIFTNDADLVIGTQSAGKILKFHAGGSDSTDSGGELNPFYWQFNRSVRTIVATPGPLNFLVQNTQNNSAAAALYQARNNVDNFVTFGIWSGNAGVEDGNQGPNESFLYASSTATLNIGKQHDIDFYTDEVNGYAGTPTLTLSRIDRTSTFNGNVIPREDLTYDLGSPTKQWNNLYVGSSTIYLGNVPMSLSGTTLLINGVPIGEGSTGQIGFSGQKIISKNNGKVWIDPSNSVGSTARIVVPSSATANTDSLLVENIGTGGISLRSNNYEILLDSAGNISIPGDIIPDTDNMFDLGSTSSQWRSLYVSTNTIYIGNIPLTITTSGVLLVAGSPVSGAANQNLNTSDNVNFASVGATTVNVSQINGTNPGNELVIQTGGAFNFDFRGNGTLEAPGHIIPKTNLAFDLGSTSSQWRSLYVGTSTIYLGGTALSIAGGSLTVDGSPVSGGTSLGDRITTSSYSVVLGTDGNLNIPGNIVGIGGSSFTFAETPVSLTLSGAGLAAVNQTYTKTSPTLYTGSGGVTVENVGGGGTWFVLIGGDAKYTSTDLVTYSLGTAGAPAPSGTIINEQSASITVNSNTWTFAADGVITLPGTLTFPSGGNITFDSSSTSNIYGVTSIEFADGTTQTTAWLAGTVSSVETNSLTTFIPETGTFTNTNQLTVSHQAHAADYGFNFTINYQSPLDETKGVTVGAINTPLILSTSSVKLRANLSTSTEWTFGTNGVLTLPVGGDIKDSTGTSVLGTTIYLLEAYANVTYTLPDSFTEDVCRYSVVSGNVNVPSAWFNTSTYIFTPLKAGYWEITAAYDVYRNAEASMVIKKNTSIVASAGSFNAVAQQVTKIVYLNGSTDYIQIYNFGGAALERSQYDGRSWFQARWVGN